MEKSFPLLLTSALVCISLIFQNSLTLAYIIQAECVSATALQLLLKLKRHLKIVYSLNDARCQVCLHLTQVSVFENCIEN